MKISVVIPCRNEAGYIVECVSAVFSCALPQDAELKVFVVDGMSDDGTGELLKVLGREFPNLKVIQNAQKFTPAAFNLGIMADPESDYVIIVGARHILSAHYLEKSILILEEHPEIWCVGGRIVNEFENHISSLVAEAMSSSFGMGFRNFRARHESGYADTVTSPVYPRKVFDQIGYFDEDLIRNQDDEFNFRVIRAGGRIWYEHSISLKYYVRSGYSNLRRQFFQYGYWKVFVNTRHRTVTTLRQLIPPAFIVYLVTLPVLLAIAPGFALAWAIPAILYVLLSIVISLQRSKSIADVLRLVRIFGIIHLSYGLGYLRGLVDFILLSRKPGEAMKSLSR